MNKIIFYSAALLFFTSCNPAPEPIRYGEEKCDWCTMTIMDRRFGSEIVTRKGKIYKFDATECMIRFMESQPGLKNQIQLQLTNSFDKPGELVDARNCYYLRSAEMPSPMGMNINPFTDSLTVKSFETENTGVVFRFNDLKEIVTSQ